MVLKRKKTELDIASQGRNILEDKLTELLKAITKYTQEAYLSRLELVATARYCGEQLSKTIIKEPQALMLATLSMPEYLAVQLFSETLYGTKVIDFNITKEEAKDSKIKQLKSFYTEAPMVQESRRLYRNFVIALLELARKEKTIERLGKEIKKTRTRYNALDLIVIPELKAEINAIEKALETKESEERYKVHLFLEEDIIL
jgi:V/A-type H+-transporting ATPase subunit D